MKSTGIVRKVDELGRVVIPKELRQTYNIKELDPLEIYVDEDKIVLCKYEASCACVFCGGTDAIKKFKGKNVCTECAAAVAKSEGE